ncbi:MAG: hypothetical protein AAGI14_05300 [Pseudomonadota bacterium]
MGRSAVEKLPDTLLNKATLRGNEYAWKLDDIPTVIKTARSIGLINLGGQLQFRIPGATCEAYEIEVRPNDKKCPENAAKQCHEQFIELLRNKAVFIEKAKDWQSLRDYEADGGDLLQAMCFVWYLATPGT